MGNWLHKFLHRLGLVSSSGAQGQMPNGDDPASAQSQEDMLPDLLTPDLLAMMVNVALSTRDDEIDCDTCFDELGRFVELHLQHQDAAAALPLVQDHLDRCGPCREEFEALLRALQATQTGA